MSGADMIVAAPWIVFGIALIGLCIVTCRARRTSSRRRPRSRGAAGNGRGPVRR